MIDESAYNDIDRYVNGRMSGEELQSFQQRMQVDATLQEEITWMESVILSMRASGQMVLKQHIASAIAGVSDGELKRYTPSINKKSFLKKWWWMFVLGSAVIIAAIAWYVLRDTSNEQNEESVPAEPYEHVAIANVDSTNSAMSADSSDPHRKPRATATELVEVIPFSGTNTKSPEVGSVSDSVKTYIAAASVAEIDGGKRKLPMHVKLNVKKDPPYTYKLDSVLTLTSNYTSAKSFTFAGEGDTIYMTDDNATTFMLLRNKGELPLQKIAPLKK